ncbi:hypothetical protein [Anoxynatronum sibiricum]|uniref:Uncharacterized protein n=1 Tax=Anoxynatronum sibiricum TaxID=210623 RepID=A0ABU9VP86_9CLOT
MKKHLEKPRKPARHPQWHIKRQLGKRKFVGQSTLFMGLACFAGPFAGSLFFYQPIRDYALADYLTLYLIAFAGGCTIGLIRGLILWKRNEADY